jgi:hypothetical protein
LIIIPGLKLAMGRIWQNYVTLYTPFSDIVFSEGDLHFQKMAGLFSRFLSWCVCRKTTRRCQSSVCQVQLGDFFPPIFAPKCWVDENKRDATVGLIIQETNATMLAPSAFLLSSYFPSFT